MIETRNNPSYGALLRAFARVGLLSFGAKWSVLRVLGVAALGGLALSLVT